jgi:alpha-mannosidase
MRKYLLEQWNFWLDELYAYSIINKLILDEWYFTDSKEKLNDKDLEIIKLGERWKKISLPVYFIKRLNLPKDFERSNLYILLDVGGESFLYINGKPYAGINQYHKEHKIPYYDQLDLLIEAVPKGLFGQHQYNPVFKEAIIFQKDEEIYKAWLIFSIIREFGLYLENINQDLQQEIENILEDTLGKIKLISSKDKFLEKIQNTKFTMDILRSLWSMPEFPKEENPIPKELKDEIILQAQDALKRMRDLKKKYPNIGEYYAVGHSHIDYAWLWPREETIRKAQRTFSTILQLMDLYPDFKFLQSSAQIYKDIKENNIFLFQKIKEKVMKEQWIIEGGMWVESDCQLPSGEALVRQFLYAQKFFEKEFQKTCKIAWLPDTFGFNPNLPQILKKADIEYFVTTKLSWNETNIFPYDLFLWKGIDGTKIIAHIYARYGGYNGSTEIKEIVENYRNYQQRNLSERMIYTFGYGDGGGGPTYEMIERLNIMKELPFIPHIKLENPIKLFEEIQKDRLPVYYGDLYLELHRGTFTTQGRTKKLHRLAENYLFALESLSVILHIVKDLPYPYEKLTQLWEKLLRNEFHDILPGSSIKEVYEDTERELKEILDAKLDIKEDSSQRKIIIYNPTSFPQELKTELEINEGEKIYYKDMEIPFQRIDKGILLYSKDVTIPPLSLITLNIKKENNNSTHNTDLQAYSNTLENSLIRLQVYEDGAFQVLYKEKNKNLFIDKGNIIIAYPDRPRYWEAWDIPLEYEKYGEVLRAEKIELTERGPLRGKIKVTRKYRNSEIIQYYTLHAFSERIDIETEIKWDEKREMLRAYFPFDILSPFVTYEVPYGTYSKPTHKNTSWEKAQFEIPVHRFIDLSQGDFGVSILNNGKYGHSVNENIIGITLLRSPFSPDYTADLGNHQFTYSLLPHKGTLGEKTLKEAEELNKTLIPIIGNFSIEDTSILSWDKNNIIVGALKQSEDRKGLILRFAEYLGKEEIINFKFGFPVKKIYETNLLEKEYSELKLKDQILEIKVKPFEIKTLKIIHFVVT